MKRSARSRLLLAFSIALVPALGGTACTNDTNEHAPEEAIAPIGPAVLELTARTDAEVSGVYRHGTISVRFEAARADKASRWALYDTNDKPMFSVEQIGGDIVTTVLGSYRQRIDAATVTKVNAGQMDAPAVMAGVTIEGDPALFDRMRALPEYAEVPGLSRALGQRGINGKTYPATLSLHLFAARIAQEQTTSGGAATGPAAKKPEALAPGSTPLPQCYTSGNQTCCRLNASSPYHCGPTPTINFCIYPPPDLRCDPNHDDCFGMCGPGCTCWDWVCGDCNYHWGCAQHDWFCKQVEDASYWQWLTDPSLPFYASQCAGGVSTIVAAIGCD